MASLGRDAGDDRRGGRPVDDLGSLPIIIVAEKIRFAANYAFLFWFYSALQWIVPALRLDTWDGALRNLDAYCFGQWPTRFTGNASTPWLTDVMSAAYATYLLYLHLVLLHGMISSVAFGRRLMNRVGTAFFVGLSGYCLVPAVGPWKAFPEMYAEPDVLRLDRGAPHLAFSAGAYYCIGNALASSEIRAALQVLLERLVL